MASREVCETKRVNCKQARANGAQPAPSHRAGGGKWEGLRGAATADLAGLVAVTVAAAVRSASAGVR